jgi:hypothetical protein
LVSERFPRSSKYHPDWVIASASGGANALWLTEWLSEAMNLRPGMRVLDLGCGLASSSVFLRREFGAQVWATDLWFSASDNLQRIRDANFDDGCFRSTRTRGRSRSRRTDGGRYLGYVRVIGRRRADARLDEPIVSIPSVYEKKPLLLTSSSAASQSPAAIVPRESFHE